MTGPLAGVRVLDFAAERAGSVCTMLLRGLGAEVVRPVAADGANGRPSLRVAVDAAAWDRGKSSVAVTSLDPARDARVARLVGESDLVVIDRGPTYLQATGLTPAVLAARNPSAVVGWLPANGCRGPLADLPADPLLLSAISGFAQWQPSTIDVPVAPVVPFVSNIQGALGAAAAVAGLIERRTSGSGQAVTVSGLHAAALLLATVTGETLDRPLAYGTPRDTRANPSFRLYRGSDGKWFFLGALVATIFLAALDAIDRLEVMVLPGIDGDFMKLFAGDNGRRVASVLEARFAEQPCAHWLEVLGAAGVPAAALCSRDQWRASAAFAAAVATEHVELDGIAVHAPLCPIRFSSPAPHALHAPRGLETRGGPPLAGLRVLDASMFLAGPLAPTLLGQWGADVVKVEPPAGDPYRAYNVSYVAANQGKRRVVLDLGDAADKESFLALVRDADVLVDNFRVALRARLGLDTAALHARNPRLVHTTVSAFGDDGPLAAAPGFDPIIQAVSGLMHACGDTDPYFTSTPVHDVATGSLAALGTVAALYARDESGRGRRVELSLAASSALVQCEELVEYPGRPPAARGSVSGLGASACRRYYRAADGWVAVVGDGALEHVLVDWGGGAVEAAIAARAGIDVIEALTRLGFAVARVAERDDRTTDEHLVAHDLLHEVADDEIGRCRVVNQIAEWSRSAPVDTVQGPPRSAGAPRW